MLCSVTLQPALIMSKTKQFKIAPLPKTLPEANRESGNAEWSCRVPKDGRAVPPLRKIRQCHDVSLMPARADGAY
jgi:hypothetical protein